MQVSASSKLGEGQLESSTADSTSVSLALIFFIVMTKLETPTPVPQWSEAHLMQILTLPTILTLTRVAAIPVLIAGTSESIISNALHCILSRPVLPTVFKVPGLNCRARMD